MARAGKNVNASMAAIVKLPDETVERLCAAYDHVWPVNYNCDGQIAVSGDRDELERCMPMSRLRAAAACR